MKEKIFTRYQIFIIAILSILQFTIVLDFMVLSPLGAFLMPALTITPAQFGMVVSAYAFSAGAAGLLSAGFADKYDRRKLLLFFYSGFIIGTLLCGIAPTYHLLLAARVVTGLFGGVIASVIFAIITDLFRMEVRGRVMGFVQMAFASSQVLGIPLALYLANAWDWHSPFLMIVAASVVVWIVIFVKMQPVNDHLKIPARKNAFLHFSSTLSKPEYIRAFAATTLLATGGFMLMPFASAYSVSNLGLGVDDLPTVYMITGIFSMVAGPLIGKLSDAVGKYQTFVGGSLWTIIVVLVYCNLGVSSLPFVIFISVVMFIGVTSRIVSSSALLSAVPAPSDRGAFMGINASVQQISGGIATIFAGLIVVQTPTGVLENYDMLGYVVTIAMIIM